VPGRDYHFLTEAQFDAKLAAGEFLEWAWVHQKYRYGTPLDSVLLRLPHTNLVANLDVQGVRSVRAAAAKDGRLRGRLVTIFVAPDSLEVLRERMLGRGPVNPEELQRRMLSAEMEMGERNNYDYVIHSGTKEQDFRALLDYWKQAQARLAG
jgi:guanylate kinase